jgi:hypothetical protein
MAWNLHAFVNRISAAHGGRNLEYGGVAAKLQLLILRLVTLLIVGCGSGCDAAAHEISMPEVQFDGGFALLRRAAMEQVVQTGESQARPYNYCMLNRCRIFSATAIRDSERIKE